MRTSDTFLDDHDDAIKNTANVATNARSSARWTSRDDDEMTTIEWTDATWNPVTGCTKVSQGCKNCYAERVFPRVYAKTGRQFTDVLCHPDRLDAPLHWRKPRRVFVNSMSDLFHEDVQIDFITRVFAIMALAPQHQFQILTKRPERMWSWVSKHRHARPWPMPNVWLGVSVEDQETADERIPWLLQTPAAVRFVSAEPLLGPIVFDQQVHLERRTKILTGAPAPRIGWVIVGGESGPNARPCDVAWVRSIVEQCRGADVPVFVKQDSGPRPGMRGRIPEDLWIREFPR